MHEFTVTEVHFTWNGEIYSIRDEAGNVFKHTIDSLKRSIRGDDKFASLIHDAQAHASCWVDVRYLYAIARH